MLSLSIIIPVYNVEKYIARCVNAILTQDVIGVNVECIFVNDCTPDNSMRIVNDILDAYHGPIRFLVLHHPENKGLSAARNTGISHAKGDYILFVDSDDYMLPGSLKYFAEQLYQYPSIDIVTARYIRSDKTADNRPTENDQILYIDNNSRIFELILQGVFDVVAWNTIIRRELIVKHHLKFINGIIHEDIPWSYHLFYNASTLLYLPNATYFYDVGNPMSIMNAEKQRNQAIKGLTGYAAGVEDILKSPPHNDSLVTDYILFITHCLMWCNDLASRVSLSKDESKPYRTTRHHLIMYSIRTWSIIPLMAILFLYAPLRLLVSFRWFRMNYYRIEQAVRQLSLKFSKR